MRNAPKQPSFGVAGGKTAEFYAKNAAEGVVRITDSICKKEGCYKRPSFGIAGSKTAEFCAQHAAKGMINIVSRRCRH